MRNLPGPGIKSMSPALAGGFLTTGPPRKSSVSLSEAACLGSGADIHYRLIHSITIMRLLRNKSFAQTLGDLRASKTVYPLKGLMVWHKEVDRKMNKT